MTHKLKFALAAGLAALALANPVYAKDYAIQAGQLIDGVSKTPRKNVTVIVKDDRIVSIENGFVAPAGAEVIDYRAATVMPGMIDCHMHVTGGNRGKVSAMAVTPERIAIQTAWNMRLILMAGVTAVRDVSGNINVLKAVQESIDQDLTVGPRMWFSGNSLTPTGGPADSSKSMDPAWHRHDGWDTNVVDGPQEAIHAVRERKRSGASHIKINSSGGVASTGIDVSRQVLAADELKAIVDTAHSLGMKVASHAHGKPGIDAALRAGVDSIEHGTYADAESYALMKQTGAYLVPTLYAGQEIRNEALTNPGSMAEDVRQKAISVTPLMSGNLGRAYKAGVKIAMGTDQLGYHAHGDNAKEFEFMVDAGMTPMDAIIAGTSHGADLIGLAEIGAIQPGKLADIIAVTSDPLADIKALQKVDFVMKGGVVFKAGGEQVIND